MRHSKIYLFSINGNVASDKIVDIYKMKHIELGWRLFCYWDAVTSLAHVGPHVGGFIPVRLGHGPAAVLVWWGCGWSPPTCGSSPWSGSSRAGRVCMIYNSKFHSPGWNNTRDLGDNSLLHRLEEYSSCHLHILEHRVDSEVEDEDGEDILQHSSLHSLDSSPWCGHNDWPSHPSVLYSQTCLPLQSSLLGGNYLL